MLSVFPSARLKLDIRGSINNLNELTVEHLFHELRKFGRLYDITLGNIDKDKGIRTAHVTFVRMYAAVGARNCLHRYKLPLSQHLPYHPYVNNATEIANSTTSTVELYLYYDSILKTSVITDFFMNHPRIVVPLLGLLFATITYLIFGKQNMTYTTSIGLC